MQVYFLHQLIHALIYFIFVKNEDTFTTELKYNPRALACSQTQSNETNVHGCKRDATITNKGRQQQQQRNRTKQKKREKRREKKKAIDNEIAIVTQRH